MSFAILKKDKKTKARLGVLTTPHGVIKTPSYVIVATRGEIKCLKPSDIKKTKTQIVIANTFHLWDEIAKGQKLVASSLKSFVLSLLGTKLSTMTDSGGFQVLSLAFDNKAKIGKFISNKPKDIKNYKRSKIKITDKGVHFKYNGKWKFLGPELSIKIQRKIGADIIFAFDECTSFFDNFKYNKKAMERTHKWALKCLKQQETSSRQMLFGIIQGGRYKQLRIKSAKFIGSLPFDGFGIGGSFGKEEMVKVLKWTIPHLPEEKPRHLLGVGQVEDIFRAVENGVDLFDCVIPTREARHGRLYTKTGNIDIRRGYYSKDKKIIEKGCYCLTCSSKIPRSKIRELIKNHDRIISAAGQRWCLMHNMWFFNNLVEKIRDSIAKNRFKEFKKESLTRFKD